ncbi:hypothetical protein BCB70_04215 [Cutibacterium modestum]|uniref:Uncharacterized protein n=1 Tax=Cutibacterium modestum HL044PA1 TaxID=765109 RepID=A0ABP2K6B0_9ACTN|nr:hypothetical protein BCB70_04215 [Cutibacterium modestum]EFS73204.1 hypothetical protein HMPREF9621_02249 [Cutibacterium modestum HL037PA2]EFS92466.1 hypothetical protein HMPREF9607_01410 [Cutibacterium modestum HL044PA1]MCP2375686.1 hypothetical protein [Cutibacterium modestum 28N]
MLSEQLCATGTALLAANPLEPPDKGRRISCGPLVVDEFIESQMVAGGRQAKAVANGGFLVNA